MKNWQKALAHYNSTIMEVVEIISNGGIQAALIVDDNRKLFGIVTDGDIRRAIINDVSMKDKVTQIMSKNFITANETDSNEKVFNLMKEKEIRHMPIIDNKGCLVNFKSLFGIIKKPKYDNFVVLMAGGLGERLQPLTNNCPKPLLNIGPKPLLETIIKNFSSYGFYRFFISVNYKGKMIESYFGDGNQEGLQIEYLREKEQLGTAGALSLLPEKPNQPVIVMNGDILTKLDLEGLMEFHVKNQASATMCVRRYNFQVPYGVVETYDHRLISIEEKPTHNFFVNAGIYVFEPDILDLVPKNSKFNMPTLFDKLIDLGIKVSTFPIHEYWMDIGMKGDFDQANSEYSNYFK